ncbi:hypothetical protein ACTJ0G_001666 [Campylobacter jejuni]|uniref:Putative sugar transferase n=1 Tax=Campylobacter jejuni subsp. jejuni TaxID=32022 RepID=F2X704_CAMJU|nr:hypothetical protein [Campylobacter jejuni]WPM69910.1 hypothetical protein OT343_07355 [Campylobacter sp. CFSAN122719]ADZ76174.1 putative sugar transferase [Campylobacter jejuni subsp. jejuni]ADZ76197.1 putative sugar transferase [Campylobacter jejuni subsp. jejuni]MEA8860586.1 hypothetical protein [Campylobacter jejuni]BDL86787.1 hypothetical protein THJ037_13750 [Campylobacter jejuni]
MNKNIVLLGASNSRIPGGLQAGLNQKNINLYNLSIGGTDSIHKIYELKRKENKDLIQNADLIILEVNLMDVTMSFCYKNLDFKIIKYINYLYEQLYLLKKKILVLLLFDLRCINDNKNKSANFITKIHKQLSLFYDFNLIDLHQKMIDTKCFKFYTASLDPYHLLATIMYQLGKNISENLNYFKFSERKLIFETNAIFKVLSPSDLISNPCLKAYKDLIYNDKYVEILDKDLISFPKPYIGYKILGVHTFLPTKKGVLSSYQSMCENYFSMVFKNSKKEIVKSFRCYNNFDWLYDDFVIDSDTIVMYNKDNLPITEISYETTIINNLSNTSDKASIVNFLLVKDDPNFIQIKNNFSQYKYTKDFSYLIPPIEMYRDIIEEYTLKTSKLIEITSLNQQISSLTQQLNHFKTFSTAKQRIQNQLPYRLGQAMIINSKNFLGYIFLPYILLSIVILYKQEQKNYKHKIKLNPESTLPPLETYPDYNEALKEKRCFTYKLGLALIEANKKWYGGGVYQIVV